MSQPEDPHELKSFEAKLAALVPRDDRLDRERLAFLAGQASVAAHFDMSRPRVGGWQRRAAWPAAFGAMSALAATLLIMLVTRPAATGLSASGVGEIAAANGSRGPVQTRTMILPEKLPDTLSARDALGGDIEQRLSTLSKVKSDASLSVEHPDSPRLTPAAWRRVDDGATSKIPSPGSSGLPVFWRVNT